MGSSVSQKTKQLNETTLTHPKPISLTPTQDTNGQIKNQTMKNTNNLIVDSEMKNEQYLIPFDNNQSRVKNIDGFNTKSSNNNTNLKGLATVSKNTKQLSQPYSNNEPNMAGSNQFYQHNSQSNEQQSLKQLSQQIQPQENSFRQAQSQYDDDPDNNLIQRQETAEFQLRKNDTLQGSMHNQLLQSQTIFIPSKAPSIQLSSPDKISPQNKLSFTGFHNVGEIKAPQKSMVSFGGSFHNKLEVASAEDCDLVKFDLLNLLEPNNNYNQSPSSLNQESPQVTNSSPQVTQSQQQLQQRELFQARKSRKQKESLVLTSEGTGIWGNPQYNNGGTFLDGSTQDIFCSSTPLASIQGYNQQIQSKNTPYLTVLERKLQAAQERRIKHIQENLRSDTDLLEVARMQMALLQAQKEAANIEGGASPTFPLNSRCEDSIEIEDDYNFSPISQKQSQQFTLNTFGEFNFNSMPYLDKNNTNENQQVSSSSTTPINNRKSLNMKNIQLNGNITPVSNHNNNNNNNNNNNDDIQSFQSESSDSQQGNANNNINNLPYDIFANSISPRGSINLCNLPQSLPSKYETISINNNNNNILTTQSSGNSVGIGQYEESNQALGLLRKSSKRQNSVRFMLPFINLEKIRESDEKEEDGATKFGESNREVSPFSNKLHHPNSPEVLSRYNPAIQAVARSLKKNDSVNSSPRSRQNSSIRTSIFDPSQKNISSNKQITDVQEKNPNNNNNNSMVLSLQQQKNKQLNNVNSEQQSIQMATQTSQSSLSEEEEGPGVLIKDILQGSHQEETDEEGQSHEQHFRFSDYNTLQSPHLNLGNYPRNSIFFVNNNDKLIVETGYKNSQDSSFEDKNANDQSFIGNRSSLNLDVMRNNQRNSATYDGNHLGNNEKQASQLNNSSIQSPLPSSQQQLSQPSQPSSSNQILMKSRTSYNKIDDTDKENPKSSTNLLIPNMRPSHSKTLYHSPSPSPTSANNFNKRNSINPNHSILSNNSYITFFNKNPDSSVIETSYVKKDVDEEGKKKINSYTLLKELGRGGFGKVKLASSELHVSSGETVKQFAIKISNKKKLKYKLVSQKVNAFTLLEREVAIMKKIDHPHLVKLYEVIDDPEDEKIYMVMEYMQKGSIMSHTYWKKELSETDPELFKKIFEDEEETNMILSKKKKDLFPKKISFEKCRKYFQQFALAIDYMHNYAQVIHRDIKPENILINEEDNLKIGDFGVSHIMESHIDSDMKDNAGTKAFTAPEGWSKIFKGKPLDMWASGVTLYNMAFGELPFFSKDQIQLRNLIVEQEPVIPAGSDPLLVDLILKLLKKDPEQRITAEEMLLHPWLTQNGQIQLKNSEMNDFKVSDWEVQGAFTKKIQISTLMKVKFKLNRQLSRARSFLQSAGLDNSGMSQDKNSMDDRSNINPSINYINNNQISHGNSLKI